MCLQTLIDRTLAIRRVTTTTAIQLLQLLVEAISKPGAGPMGFTNADAGSFYTFYFCSRGSLLAPSCQTEANPVTCRRCAYRPIRRGNAIPASGIIKICAWTTAPRPLNNDCAADQVAADTGNPFDDGRITV
jgi:hypothetical protein